VLLMGSGEAYGPADPGGPPFTEASPLRPASPFARTKAAADLLGAGLAERGLHAVRVRAFNHSGPGQSEAFVASSFAKQLVEIASGQRPGVLRVGNLDCVRDFLDVEDVVDAYLKLCDPHVPAGAYNVASGRGTRIGALLERLCELAAVSPRIEIDRARVRPTDAALGDATRLRDATGWAPRIPLDATLERLLRYWRGRISAS
jgi:nucleoside-diphosphate-sugar epimerase